MPYRHELYTQLFTRPPIPSTDCTNKTIIVTGSNTGIGFQAAKHFAALKPRTIILAVRSLAKGRAAKTAIETALPHLDPSVLEVWQLDYASYASCREFAARVATLERVDIVVLNAAISSQKFELVEGNESQVTVNVISPVLLLLLLLPTLRATAKRHAGVVPVVSVVSSCGHAMTAFSQRRAPRILERLNDERRLGRFEMIERYQDSKLMLLFAVREIAARTAKTEPFVVINSVNPGICYTELQRNMTGPLAFVVRLLNKLLGWTAEEGGRTLVFSSTAGPESHGVYISGSQVKNTGLAPRVESNNGQETQKKLWSELAEKLEEIQEGISRI